MSRNSHTNCVNHCPQSVLIDPRHRTRTCNHMRWSTGCPLWTRLAMDLKRVPATMQQPPQDHAWPIGNCQQ
eukprot:12930148-Prorocentrum_lima.AAC.1